MAGNGWHQIHKLLFTRPLTRRSSFVTHHYHCYFESNQTNDMPTRRTRVFVADADRSATDTLIRLLTGQNPQQLSPLDDPARAGTSLLFVGKTHTAHELPHRMAALHALTDVLLLDPDWIDPTLKPSKLLHDHPHLKILAFSANTEGDFVAETIRSGVHGFVSKKVRRQLLERSIEQVRCGEFPLHLSDANFEVADENPETEILLTPIEEAILNRTIAGLTAAEMAHDLRITISNTDRIQRVLRAKFKVPNAAALVREAMLRGFGVRWQEFLPR
jgi:DNA-binding NarL/FixJ family response regulator